jgi:hypothetical protein
MSAKPLLHRQVKLVEYLTSSDAIFGDKRTQPLDPALQGTDRRLLHIEARFSHEKRMEKISAVFPKTFELLDAGREALVRAFTETCPPMDISRLENARQFHDFLLAHWRQEPPMPPYLRDVVACELAFASGRFADEERTPTCVEGSVRRQRGVVLVHSAYDVRPIFENALGTAVPLQRDTRLAIVSGSHADQPRIFELAAAVFELLGALDDWVDRAAFDALPAAEELISDLTEAGLLEVCP